MAEYDLICFGTNKGKILSYYIPVRKPECYDEEDECGGDVVQDKDVTQVEDVMVFKKYFE